MSRKVFDRLASAAGVVVVVVLVIAGGLLVWGHSFVNSNVQSQSATTVLLSGNLQIQLADPFHRARAIPMLDSSFDNPPEDRSDR